jgi:hypothetical protein
MNHSQDVSVILLSRIICITYGNNWSLLQRNLLKLKVSSILSTMQSIYLIFGLSYLNSQTIHIITNTYATATPSQCASCIHYSLQ